MSDNNQNKGQGRDSFVKEEPEGLANWLCEKLQL